MKKLEPMLDEAEEALDAGDPEGALDALGRVLKERPRHPEALYLKGLAHADLQEFDEAVRALEEALRIAPEYAEAALAMADIYLYDLDEPEEALALCEEMLRRDTDETFYAEFLNLKGVALCHLGDFEAALGAFDRARSLRPDRVSPAERGWALFEVCRFRQASKDLSRAVRENPDDAGSHYYLALALERLGDDRAAARHFRIARRLDPEGYSLPVTLEREEFAALVEEALAGLPQKLREYLSNVAVAVERWPEPSDLGSGEGRLSPLVLGMYRGTPLPGQTTHDPWSTFPSQIVLYQRNIEYVAGDREGVVEEVRTTILHEVGHFLGLDEDELAERGLA